MYCQGEGGQALDPHGQSKAQRPDRKPLVVGLALERQGWPLCSEWWPGTPADGPTLLPVVKRLRQGFRVRRVSLVAKQFPSRLAALGFA